MKRVLVVHDVEMTKNAMVEFLTRNGVLAVGQFKFESAVRALYDKLYDYLIIDEDVLKSGEPMALQKIRNASNDVKIYVTVDFLPSNPSNGIEYLEKADLFHKFKELFST